DLLLRGALLCLVLISGLVLTFAASADALDDTLALFAENKYPQTEAAVAQLTALAPPQAAAILDALDNSRLYVDPASRAVVYKTGEGQLVVAKSGQPFAGSEDDLKKV